jgi:SulP family sulfate permease
MAVLRAGALLEPLDPLPLWKREFAGYGAALLRADLLAGLTVGIVALPLALAFGVTSGAGATAGLITAIVAGIVASLFGGSRYQITGPTGAMTVVLVPIVAHFGVERIFAVGILAGIMLLAMAILRLGRVINLIPWPVIVGFTNGIAIIIFLQQLPAAFGVHASAEAGVLLGTLDAVRAAAASFQPVPLAFALGTAAIMLAWPAVNKTIPGGIVALIVATLASVFVPAHLATIGTIPRMLPMPHLPAFDVREIEAIVPAAFAIAVLAALESLLSAIVADGMTLRDRHDPDHEIAGQGLANIAAALFGGIPCTGALARTAVGVRSGGHTRLVGITHGFVLLAVVMFLGTLTSRIPLAALAGILMVTSYRMLEFSALRALARSTKSDFTTMLVTTLVTISFNLILAIEVGLAVAAVFFIRRMIGTLRFEQMDIAEAAPGIADYDHDLMRKRVLAYRVEGPLFFGVAGRFIENLTALSNIDVVILRLRRVQTLDASGAQALDSIDRELRSHGITLLLSGLQPQPFALLTNMGLVHEKHLFATTDDAIAHAWSHVKRARSAAVS